MWFYPFWLKPDVLVMFKYFTSLIEKQFNQRIKIFFTDGGGEFIALASFLATYVIQHYQIPPYTLQHNSISDKRHQHIVNTGVTLLNHTTIPTKYWTLVFKIIIHLIYKLLTPFLNYNSQFDKLFSHQPNYQNYIPLVVFVFFIATTIYTEQA